MRNAFKLIAAILLIAFFGCSSDDTPPVIPTVSFERDRDIVEPGDEVTFTSTNTDADSFLWEFGDGNTSTDENPVHTYSETGSFTITLTVTSTTGDTANSTATIVVGKRFVRAFLITSINHTDASGKPWDDDGSGPELFFGFKPTAITNLTVYDRGTDVTANDLPTGGTLPPEAQVELTDEDWDFLFLDDDDPLGEFTAEELMAVITANPATTPADDKDYDTGQGVFTLTIAEFVVQIFYDIKN